LAGGGRGSYFAPQCHRPRALSLWQLVVPLRCSRAPHHCAQLCYFLNAAGFGRLTLASFRVFDEPLSIPNDSVHPMHSGQIEVEGTLAAG